VVDPLDEPSEHEDPKGQFGKFVDRVHIGIVDKHEDSDESEDDTAPWLRASYWWHCGDKQAVRLCGLSRTAASSQQAVRCICDYTVFILFKRLLLCTQCQSVA
jgi:hypothetical protein